MSELPTLVSARKRAIREKIKTILLSQTEAKNMVFINRTIPTQHEDLPAILIYSLSEGINKFNEAPKDYRREMNVRIECIAQASKDDDLDFELEKIADKVEELLEIDETLGDLVDTIELKGTDYQSEPDAQSPVGVLALTYAVVFYTDAIRPGSDKLNNFEGADLKYQIGHHASKPDGVNDAEDEINLETGD